MQTYSHFLMTAALAHLGGGGRRVPALRPGALLLGSVMPDVPLILLTGRYMSRRIGPNQAPGQLFGSEYDALYFNDPLWISGHNLFHTPPLVLLYLLLGFLLWRHGRRGGDLLFWFAAGCALHAGVDILTHHNDGPLLLYPFNWQLRFMSPLSYWDPAHYGRQVSAFEHGMDLLILVGFIRRWRAGRGPDATQSSIT